MDCINQRGIAYGIGVGPGDPELMTLKAVRLIRENDIIVVPGKDPKDSVAYKIAEAVIPEISGKTLVSVSMPMVNDKEALTHSHREAAKQIESYLDDGKNVVYLTLGDVSIYCTFSYLQKILEEDGYAVELVSGIPSFCAAAARLNTPLVEGKEELHIVPGFYRRNETVSYDGTTVLMKSASHMSDVKEYLREKNTTVFAVENCGMENEKVYQTLDEIPDDAGYFSLIIAKNKY
ncbi:MAG: precorrin-2 C(20)-methyltransferase [Lachnospiraceae bacterium]|nr:precorrin-2 C(20)-methyltransferase [Lachnospiraceae bacterium]